MVIKQDTHMTMSLNICNLSFPIVVVPQGGPGRCLKACCKTGFFSQPGPLTLTFLYPSAKTWAFPLSTIPRMLGSSPCLCTPGSFGPSHLSTTIRSLGPSPHLITLPEGLGLLPTSLSTSFLFPYSCNHAQPMQVTVTV